MSKKEDILSTLLGIALTILIPCILMSCQESAYNDAYEDGYNDAVELYGSDYDIGYENGYDIGYEDGYDDGHEEGIKNDWTENIVEIARYFEVEAVHYVGENANWHPEEALTVIESYQNNESFYSDGSTPSEQDFLDAIESLIYFYRYFYDGAYGE